jgi:hypothetical protein
MRSRDHNQETPSNGRPAPSASGVACCGAAAVDGWALRHRHSPASTGRPPHHCPGRGRRNRNQVERLLDEVATPRTWAHATPDQLKLVEMGPVFKLDEMSDE